MSLRSAAPLLLAGAAALLSGCAPALARGTPPEVELAERLSGFIWPLPIEAAPSVSSRFGARQERHHDGLDIRGRMGDPIYSAAPGRVTFSGWRNGYGWTVVVDHGGGVSTLYAHASSLSVAAGELVVRGQVIGAVGASGNATGSHLHFEVAWAGRPLDPVPLLPRLRDR